MKILPALLVALCPFVAASSVRAQLTAVDPAYSATPYFIHTNADNIVSYDWAANGSVYYQTSTSAFTFGGFYQDSGGTSTQVVAGSGSVFSGASVVSVGQYVYYNSSDSSGNQDIFKYGPVGGSAAVTLASTNANYALAQNAGRLFITGAPGFGDNQLFYSNLGADGSLLNNPATSLGTQPGSSGPLAFDRAGNLFYAPGYGNLSIYRFSAAEVAAAIANPTTNPLNATGHVWLDYSSLYGNESGGTSMLLDGNGGLLLALTNFVDPSLLVKFGVGTDGAYDGTHDTLFQDAGILGDLRLHDGGLYLSAGNEIFSIVPEPSTVCLLILAAGLVLGLRWRTSRAGRVASPV